MQDSEILGGLVVCSAVVVGILLLFGLNLFQALVVTLLTWIALALIK